MARSNHPITLKDLARRDVDGGGGRGGEIRSGSGGSIGNSLKRSNSYSVDYSSLSSSVAFRPPKVCHIPTLPKADDALELLQRVVREFLPIIQRRKYNVISISELCCCNDGLDFEPNRRRKLYKAANNIWGYNRTTWSHGTKSHTIHLRLRLVQAHKTRLHLYEDVAGTLAHELAHCEYGPHNDKFYKLMDEILEEHACIMSSNLTTHGGAESLPAFGGSGHVLGSGRGKNLNPKSSSASSERAARLQALALDTTSSTLPAAEAGQKLGGDGNFQQWMTPRDAAVAAALARHRQQQLRLRGNRCCRPCTINQDVDKARRGNDSEEEEEDYVEVVETDPTLAPKRSNSQKKKGNNPDPSQRRRARDKQQYENVDPQQYKRKLGTLKQPSSTKNKEDSDWDSKPSASSPSVNVDIIDLTGEEDETPCVAAPLCRSLWNCTRCTFLNQPSHANCGICHHPR